MPSIAPWQQRILTQSRLLRIITDPPSFSPATRLALSGEAILQNACDTAARGRLEIADAFRKR
jgi:hypothetical protein